MPRVGIDFLLYYTDFTMSDTAYQPLSTTLREAPPQRREALPAVLCKGVVSNSLARTTRRVFPRDQPGFRQTWTLRHHDVLHPGVVGPRADRRELNGRRHAEPMGSVE